MSAVERFVKDNKKFFLVGYPIDFINIEGITEKRKAMELRKLCEVNERIRTASKEAKRLQEEYEKLPNPNGLKINIYTPGEEKRLRIYKLINQDFESDDSLYNYSDDEETEIPDESEKQKLLTKFNEKLNKMSLEELRALYCNWF